MIIIDPYKAGMFEKNPYAKKRDILGSLIVVLDGRLDERGLQLIAPISRALLAGEIHELILTDEEGAGPNKKVNKIAYLGFFEVSQSGVMVTGDDIYVARQKIGRVAGFDITHMPNHLNIVIYSDERTSGLEKGLELGTEFKCSKPNS
ncbi:hypothetical protein MFMK1_001760 [Metallumcola ferriviriculae]|uniref:DUF6917 domain-containing protein n=1 Tax=Metallumcola ferriviriculae TaxID=3039180 RepID=A0AAU0UMD1_9FIRM|nr:hypothetical protein MFMK1_001760 [Desulfitibacteraceae bacterium MK1]